MRAAISLLLFAILVLVQPIQAQHESEGPCGVIVMAHGGTEEWNTAIEDAVQPLLDEQPTEVAFGMANPTTLQEATTALEAQGVHCIVVARLFVSGQSFLHQTEFLFGLRPDPPDFFIWDHGPGGHGEHKAPTPLSFNARILLSQEGLLDAPQMSKVIKRRAMSMSTPSAQQEESVLIIAHGPGDDDENAEWLEKLDTLAQPLRATGQFIAVGVHTLREDWEDKRVKAEEGIRAFMETESVQGRRVLVIPFRVFGFGPYADVLEGLSYEAQGQGLLPSPEITVWLRDLVAKTVENASRCHDGAAGAGDEAACPIMPE